MTAAQFKSILQRHKRIAIAGGPKSGKTTLANSSNLTVIHTDDWMTVPWELAPMQIINALAKAGPQWILEGVQVPRVLRKLKGGLIPDAVIWLDEPKMKLSTGQESMRKGIRSVMADWMNAPTVPIASIYGWKS